MRDEGDATRGVAPKPAVARARRVDAAALPSDDFTYAEMPPGSGGRGQADRRTDLRHRTRLRSGKLVNLDGTFLCECLVNNRSVSGCRLRLSKPALEVPATLFFYDDQSELLYQGRVIWSKEREVGLRLFSCRSSPLYRAIVGAMRRKFYTLGI